MGEGDVGGRVGRRAVDRCAEMDVGIRVGAEIVDGLFVFVRRRDAVQRRHQRPGLQPWPSDQQCPRTRRRHRSFLIIVELNSYYSFLIIVELNSYYSCKIINNNNNHKL